MDTNQQAEKPRFTDDPFAEHSRRMNAMLDAAGRVDPSVPQALANASAAMSAAQDELRTSLQRYRDAVRAFPADFMTKLPARIEKVVSDFVSVHADVTMGLSDEDLVALRRNVTFIAENAIFLDPTGVILGLDRKDRSSDTSLNDVTGLLLSIVYRRIMFDRVVKTLTDAGYAFRDPIDVSPLVEPDDVLPLAEAIIAYRRADETASKRKREHSEAFGAVWKAAAAHRWDVAQ